MKALYLAVLALCMSMAMCASTRTWNCSIKAPGRVDCQTIFYDIFFHKTVILKNFTSCASDQLIYNPSGVNCLDAAQKMRILCPLSLHKNSTENCRIFKLNNSTLELRTYVPVNKCVVSTSPTNPEICNCFVRGRIMSDMASKDLLYNCKTQVRIDTNEANCFTNLPLDPYKLSCVVNRLHELEI